MFEILRKIIVGTIGGIILLWGIIAIFVPSPALLLIPLGLIILASEFPAVKRWVKRYREKIKGSKKQPMKKLDKALEKIN